MSGVAAFNRPRAPESNPPPAVTGVAPLLVVPRRSLGRRCFSGAAHAGPSATSIGALTLKTQKPSSSCVSDVAAPFPEGRNAELEGSVDSIVSALPHVDNHILLHDQQKNVTAGRKT